jgi:50S ribosomal subunit-associated GTPase HflX
MSSDFVLDAVDKFLSDNGSSNVSLIPHANKIDQLLSKLEKSSQSLYESNLENLQPVITSNTKELQITLQKAKDLLNKQSEYIVKCSDTGHLRHCDSCHKKDKRIEELESELNRIKNTLYRQEDELHSNKTDNLLLELEELESIYYSNNKVLIKL